MIILSCFMKALCINIGSLQWNTVADEVTAGEYKLTYCMLWTFWKRSCQELDPIINLQYRKSLNSKWELRGNKKWEEVGDTGSEQWKKGIWIPPAGVIMIPSPEVNEMFTYHHVAPIVIHVPSAAPFSPPALMLPCSCTRLCTTLLNSKSSCL